MTPFSVINQEAGQNDVVTKYIPALIEFPG